MKISDIKIALIIFVGLVVFGFAFFSVAQENSSSDMNIFLDSDQDGLSDEEEKGYGTDPENRDTDGDGYSDGAEIKSGYDPLKPAPGDKIVVEQSRQTTGDSQQKTDNETNLTQEVSLQVANLITSSSSEEEEITLENLDSLISETLENELTFDDLPEINEDEINIKEQNYDKYSEEKKAEKEREDALEYLTAISYIAASNSPQKISTINDVEKLIKEVVTEVELFSLSLSDASYFKGLAEKGELAMEQLNEVEVPENFLDLHIRGLKLAKYAISLKDEVQPDPNDPISGITSLSKVQNLLVLSMEYSGEVSSKLSGLGIAEIPLDLE
ncbi:hypothetical protein BMS3Abin15_00443 [bacterium BMS3Abin15]|nr:hypothetical protein BMS3Abin15_00443 [bacterium BMS3Abin15]HDZ85056.1 hypothetical protein [Candidatus Moranbacteria bacterium]